MPKKRFQKKETIIEIDNLFDEINKSEEKFSSEIESISIDFKNNYMNQYFLTLVSDENELVKLFFLWGI